MATIEVSQFELHLLLGLVLDQRLKYEEKAKLQPSDQDTGILAKNFRDLHEKIHRAAP